MNATTVPVVCCWCGNADLPKIRAVSVYGSACVKHVPSGLPATHECVDSVACLRRRGAMPLHEASAKDAETSSKRIAARLTRMKLGRR